MSIPGIQYGSSLQHIFPHMSSFCSYHQECVARAYEDLSDFYPGLRKFEVGIVSMSMVLMFMYVISGVHFPEIYHFN